jgi:hypothetical protein
MFRNDLVNRNDPRYPKMSMKPGMRLGLAVAAYRGKSDVDLNRFEDPADILYVYVARARSSGAGRESCPFLSERDFARVFEARSAQSTRVNVPGSQRRNLKRDSSSGKSRETVFSALNSRIVGYSEVALPVGSENR